jgi:hypothetical protein
LPEVFGHFPDEPPGGFLVMRALRTASPQIAVPAPEMGDKTGLRIEVMATIGHGATELSAFDGALFAAGCQTVETGLTAHVVASLRDLAARRQVEFVQERVGMLAIATEVERQPACALVLATYQTEGWR